jgi:arginine repressor
MKHDTAGDPMTGLKWTRRTTAKIAAELKLLGINVSDRTVARLLKQMGFALRVNHKKRSHASPEDRDAQFMHIAELRERFAAQGFPLISIDTKKKELVGRFKNAGTSWELQPVLVNDHDFRSDATGIAIPYGIYDLRANRGTVFVGNSCDTPEFAVECVERWWHTEGRQRHHNVGQLAILADGGGSNASNSRVWKYRLQNRLCNRLGLTVTVAHYPPGTSKWNPIEHRLFSEISKNWAGHPLDSYQTILNHIQTTTTSAGLRVQAHLVDKTYEKGVKITDAQMRDLAITKDARLPKWNYILRPA